MKKKTLLNAIIVLLLIIMGASIAIAAFIVNKGHGFGFIGGCVFRLLNDTNNSEEMIKEVTYYDIICDRCGKSFTDESETCYPDTDTCGT